MAKELRPEDVQILHIPEPRKRKPEDQYKLTPKDVQRFTIGQMGMSSSPPTHRLVPSDVQVLKITESMGKASYAHHALTPDDVQTLTMPRVREDKQKCFHCGRIAPQSDMHYDFWNKRWECKPWDHDETPGEMKARVSIIEEVAEKWAGLNGVPKAQVQKDMDENMSLSARSATYNKMGLFSEKSGYYKSFFTTGKRPLLIPQNLLWRQRDLELIAKVYGRSTDIEKNGICINYGPFYVWVDYALKVHNVLGENLSVWVKEHAVIFKNYTGQYIVVAKMKPESGRSIEGAIVDNYEEILKMKSLPGATESEIADVKTIIEDMVSKSKLMAAMEAQIDAN